MIIFSKVYQGLAPEDPPDHQASKAIKESEDPQERIQWGLLGPQAVLVHQAPQGHRDLQDHQVKKPKRPNDRCVQIRGSGPCLELGHQPVWPL